MLLHSTLARLETQLNACLIKDRYRLHKKIKNAYRQLNHSTQELSSSLLQNIESAINASITKAKQRQQALPLPTFDEHLPVNQKLEELKTAIATHSVIIVCGETGSGKTTQLPKIALSLGLGAKGLIGHTQPRRLAARAVAARLAEELKTPLGKTVGFKVRFTDHVSAQSAIKLMTDGILLSETLSDRFLNAYEVLIIDEAHERSLNIDFLLGYLKQLLPKRPDLKVIVTSATIDAKHFSRHFHHAPIIEVSGRTFPVEIRYRPLSQKDEDERTIEMEEAILQAAEELSKHGPGDILVFLPGEREIRDTAKKLRQSGLTHYEILPLFARLSHEEQQRIFKPSHGRRLILATNVAETSLTVPGVRYVIDTGLAKINRYLPRAKVEQLALETISQAAARQRSGRCGRVESGICIRLYSEVDFNQRPAFTDPEILRSNLAAVILRMAALNLGTVDTFPFLDQPSSRLVADGYQVLSELGAIDSQGKLTPIGQTLARLPIDPKIGRLLLASQSLGCTEEILIIAAALSIQDPRERPFDAKEATDRAHALFSDEKSDFLAYLHLWHFFTDALNHKKSNRSLVDLCHKHFLSYLRLREWRELYGQLKQIVLDLNFTLSSAFPSANLANLSEKQRQKWHEGAYEQIHKALISGLIANIGQKHPEENHYQGTRSTQFQLSPTSGLKKRRPKWIVASELLDTGRLYARCVAQIDPEWVISQAEHLLKYHYFDPHWEKKRGEVIASERVTLYDLTLIPRRPVSYGRISPEEARTLFIRGALVQGDYESQAPFFQHNFTLIAEVEQLEHKTRRQDVLVDEDTLFAFYDERLPPHIVDVASFEAWRKQAEQEAPTLLYLTRDILMRHAATQATEIQFPAVFTYARDPLKLHYRFELHHPLDGVTVDIPLAMLNQLDAAPFEWLVPGMIREKLHYLIKALPKPIRRHCIPIPDCITRFLSSSINIMEPLEPQLLTFIQHETGDSTLNRSTINWAKLPPHLCFTFRILDEANQELDIGKDLSSLQNQFGQVAQLHFRDSCAEFERHNVTTWDLGTLPEHLPFARGHQQLIGYPGLCIENDQVALRLFDTQEQAERQHRQGVIQLLQWQLKDHMKQLKKGLPGLNTIALQLRHMGSADALLDEMIACICDRAFIGDDPVPRTEKNFTEQKQRSRTRLPAVTQALTQRMTQIAEHYSKVALAIQKHRLNTELTAELGQLVYKGFLAKTPWEALAHFPRYLQAKEKRLEKYAQNPQRDAQRAAQIQTIWQKWVTEVEKRGTSTSSDVINFRWQIEELRVSLFAQELKTPYPVSVKRLEKNWSQLIQA